MPPSQSSSAMSPPICKLPVEPIESIARLLPPEAAASFTRTCRPIWSTLEAQYLDQLRAEDRGVDRVVFLKLLERDLPEIFCHYCSLLHEVYEGYKSPQQWFRCLKRRCAPAEKNQGVYFFIQEGFNHATFKLAIKFHRRGLVRDCTDLLSALSYSDTNFQFGCTRYTHQRAATYRIINGHLLLRNQDWIRFPNKQNVLFPSFVSLKACPHWRHHLDTPALKSSFRDRISRRESHWRDVQLNSTCRTCSSLYQCRYCHAELQINTQDLDERGVVLIITRWMDLGEGLTQEDPLWKSNVFNGSFDNFKNCAPTTPGSIKAAFEEDRSLEELLKPNDESLLYSTRQPPQRQTVGKDV
jgi:hypothetical protein